MMINNSKSSRTTPPDHYSVSTEACGVKIPINKRSTSTSRSLRVSVILFSNKTQSIPAIEFPWSDNHSHSKLKHFVSFSLKKIIAFHYAGEISFPFLILISCVYRWRFFISLILIIQVINITILSKKFLIKQKKSKTLFINADSHH